VNDDNARDHQGNAVSLPEEARQQVVSYLEHQAGKSLADLLLLVDRAASLTEQSLLDISDVQAVFRPSESEWSVVEIISHVSASLRGTTRIVGGLARGMEPSAVLDAITGAGAKAVLPAGMRADVAAAYDDLRSVVRMLEDGVALEKTARHPFFGDLNWKEWVAFVYVHARDHAAQVEKVKSSPGFPL
jgi:hypothetical protein